MELLQRLGLFHEIPDEEYIPPAWDGPHAGLRLIEAFRTLMNLPGGAAVRASSGYWPTIQRDWEDYVAQQEADDDDKVERSEQHNRIRVRPTAQEVTRMESSLWWAGRYICDPFVARIVNIVALFRARDYETDHIAAKLKMKRSSVRRFNRSGLDDIAAGLRRDRIEIF